MRIDRLLLTSFRTYESLEVEFPPGPNVVVGPNAAGKTNLLESVVVLGSGRSHRAAQDGELVTWGADFSRLESEVSGRNGTKLEIVIARTPSGGGRKRVAVNGVPRRPSALPAALPVVVFAPEEMLLVVGSPSLRRQAIDTLVEATTPAAAASVATYGRALTQRNNLLKAIRDGTAGVDELRYWDGVVIEEGSRIVDWRRLMIADLAQGLAAAHAEIAPGEAAVELAYVTNAETVAGETTRDALRRRLTETAQKEQWNGATLIGPHRDDVVFLGGGRELAGYASRGQQRTAILAFKLAQLDLLRTESGEPPLLLLDDVFSELDPQRRGHLVRRIGELPQAFVTTTTTADLDPSLVAAATTWQVTPGHLKRVAAG